ncbi:hypothetical protein ACL02T_29925 [Pseudonocardia sp. RS010]|uniref:hypothetical protein n=1 Tax=Pseudonocardia sp. RS010 TaxID=3385979 RepID=UPI0039A32E64
MAVIVGEGASAGDRLRRLWELRDPSAGTAADDDHPPDLAGRLAAALVDRDADGAELRMREQLAEILDGRRAAIPAGLSSALTSYFEVPADYFDNASIAARVDVELYEAALKDCGVESIRLCRGPITPVAAANALASLLHIMRESPPGGTDENAT